MWRYLSYLAFGILLVFISCENESSDAPTLTGHVKGKIRIVDCYGYYLSDLSGVDIKISSGNFSADTITDENGNFSFDSIPFGKYQLYCIKENYIQQTGHAAFGHVGGDVSTTVSETLLGIPDFGYIVDSLERNYCHLNCYLHFNGATKTFAGADYLSLMFFSDSPDVDSANYDTYDIDYGYAPSGNEYNWTFNVCYSDALTSLTSDTIYCRIYPIPFVYNLANDEYLSLPKGKPSNVFAIPNN